jgi:hypothetical protein
MFHLVGIEVSGLKETEVNIIAKFSNGVKWLHNNINKQSDLYSVLIEPIYKMSLKLCSVYEFIVYSLTLWLNNNLTYLHTPLIKNKTLHFYSSKLSHLTTPFYRQWQINSSDINNRFLTRLHIAIVRVKHLCYYWFSFPIILNLLLSTTSIHIRTRQPMFLVLLGALMLLATYLYCVTIVWPPINLASISTSPYLT